MTVSADCHSQVRLTKVSTLSTAGRIRFLYPMMKKPLTCALVLILLLTACTARNATTDITREAWSEDLRYLAAELPRRHVNAFHTVSREVFTNEVAKLDASIPRLNNDEIVVALMRIVALVGDGHTHLDLPFSFPRYPIELHWFGEELRVVTAGAPYHSALGARVVGVGTVPRADLMERTTQLVPRGETEGRTRLTAAMQITSPEVLHGLGIVADRERAPFVLDNAAGERVTITVSPVRLGVSQPGARPLENRRLFTCDG